MRDSLRHFFAEFIGTFALVFIGSGAIMMSRRPGATIGLLEIALAHGLVLAVFVTATMRVSGHLNPAVTLALLVTRRIGSLMAAIYFMGQIAGGVLAAYALRALYPVQAFMVARGGGQSVALDITSGQAYMLEAIATFFLVFVVFGTAVDRHSPRVGGLAIGFTLTAAILAIGPLTGGSLNPARSFGPAVASGVWEGQLIYWIGPLVGGVAAGALYHFLFLYREPEPVDHGAIAPKP
jgi:MIP family channel proteins